MINKETAAHGQSEISKFIQTNDQDEFTNLIEKGIFEDSFTDAHGDSASNSNEIDSWFLSSIADAAKINENEEGEACIEVNE